MGVALSLLVVPPEQVRKFRATADILPGPVALFSQAMVAAFIGQGNFARHLRRMRALYAERRGYVVEALAAMMGDMLHVQTQAGGIHVLAHLDTRRSDKTLAAAANADGLAVGALSDWRMRKTRQKGGLLMGFANFDTADAAAMAVRRLKRAIA